LAVGRYKSALVTLRAVPDTEPDALVVRLRALAALGRFDEAAAAFAQQADPTPAQRAAHVEGLLAARQFPAALAAAKDAVAAHPASAAAHFLLGQAAEGTGDLAAAKAAYQWFLDAPQEFLGRWNGLGEQDAAFATADDTVTIARAIDRWASLTGGYRNNPQLDQQVFGMFVRAYDVIDRGHAAAHVAAAEYLMSHDNREQAAKELEAALTRNPNDARALTLAGEVAVRGFNFDGADQAADAMRDVDPASMAADLTEARCLILQRRPQEAERPVRRVLAKRPDDVEALGLLAATYALRLLDQPLRQTLAKVESLDPDNATAYLEVAAALGAQRQYPRAAEMYKVAIDRQPNWTEPRNGLGLLYTQSGDEDDARRELEAARTLDPFNVATTNYLRLLDQMAGYARKETEHFVIVYDPAADPIIAEYFAEYLESIYKDVTGNYRHEPGVKTIIEVFPTHDMFSVRTTGSPWIGTVGASTGRVIALVAPRAGERTMGPFNWAQVLRHEFTHTVTLSATDNRIQHWMSEGLAVVEERVPVRWEWVPMLVNAVRKDELFPLDRLTWGFVRPKRPIDRQLAYAQSAWVCMYLEEKYGRDAVLQMVEEFK
ncbi:MAG TPA: tetratricopeptide repeat protein, partial [Tepidisphaeraceae bacterium]|nr:tetratricopeptide repeat protein [Tepidisphaeraceae bacterium]